jgi:hypothetical protein
MTTLEARFWEKVDRTDECWGWTACRVAKGYGQFSTGGGRRVGAHRFAYELLVGPIPDGLQLDHLCRNRACVNPAHLEPVTCKENILRGESFSAINARKTHCKFGHPFAEANTYITAKGRECRLCKQRLERERIR